VAALEEQQRARSERDGAHPRAVAVEHAGDVVVALVLCAADQRRVLEIAALGRVAQRDRDHEIGLVEVPAQLVAGAHGGQVERAERIGVAIQPRLAQRRRHELHQALPLEELTERVRRRNQVVGDRLHRRALGQAPARMALGQTGFGKPEIHGRARLGEVSAADQRVGLLGHPLGGFRGEESGQLAGAAGGQLRAALRDQIASAGRLEVEDGMADQVDVAGSRRVRHAACLRSNGPQPSSREASRSPVA
jgi:hypothetical protein